MYYCKYYYEETDADCQESLTQIIEYLSQVHF